MILAPALDAPKRRSREAHEAPRTHTRARQKSPASESPEAIDRDGEADSPSHANIRERTRGASREEPPWERRGWVRRRGKRPRPAHLRASADVPGVAARPLLSQRSAARSGNSALSGRGALGRRLSGEIRCSRRSFPLTRPSALGSRCVRASGRRTRASGGVPRGSLPERTSIARFEHGALGPAGRSGGGEASHR